MNIKTGHNRLSDNEFVKQFANCSLDPDVFDHEAHLRLAWIYINNSGLEQAKENIQKQLKKFVAHAGATDKYHKTLTIAAIEAVNHFINKSESSSFHGFVKEFPQLNDNFKELINSHYSFDIFKSSRARIEYVKPDVSPFRK